MKTIISLLVLAITSLSAMAQADLSGIWKLNKSKSTLNSDFSMAPEQLILTQTAELLTVERHSTFNDQSFTFTDKFTLDGIECINPGWEGTQKKSVALWADDKNSLKVTTKIPMQDGEIMTITETFQLSETYLKIVTSASSSYGDVSETYLFDKQ